MIAYVFIMMYIGPQFVLGLPIYRHHDHHDQHYHHEHKALKREPHWFSLIRQCQPLKTEHTTPEDAKTSTEKVLANLSALGRLPRIAVVLGQKLRGYTPDFHSERMKRLSDLLSGTDLFVAVPDEDADMVQYLPEGRFKVVGFQSWRVDVDSFDPAQRQDPALLWNFQGFFSQLLRTQDAFQMIEQREKEKGWEYDVVLRVRPEVIHTDICELGLNQGCAAKGAWPLAVSASILAEEQPFMAVKHDAIFGGRRNVMKSAMDNVQAHLEQKLGIKIQRRLKCQSGSPKICSQEVTVTAAENREMFNGTYKDSWQEAVLHVVNKDNGLRERTLWGMNLRRLGYDHYGSDHMGPGYPFGYGNGCEPYPPIKNSTHPPGGADARILSVEESGTAAQIEKHMFAEYGFDPGP